MHPTVGAVMPTYNNDEFLVEAIMSVVGQVTHLVVVDDGTVDHTRRILEKVQEVRSDGKLSVVRLPENGGTAKAINEGIAALRVMETDELKFDWLTWVSSDNVCYPYWISTATEAIKPDTGVVYSAMDCFGDKREHVSYREYDPKLMGRKPICYFGCSFLIRADIWHPHRGAYAHDYDNWLRVEESCWQRGLTFVGLKQPLARYRMHPGQLTRNPGPGTQDARHWHRVAVKRRAENGCGPPG